MKVILKAKEITVFALRARWGRVALTHYCDALNPCIPKSTLVRNTQIHKHTYTTHLQTVRNTTNVHTQKTYLCINIETET